MAAKAKVEVTEQDPEPEEDETGAITDRGAESGYSDGGGLPNHNALLPQPGEKGAPDKFTHFKVTAAGISVPVVFLDSEGKTGLTSDGKYRGEILKREEIGNEERIAHLLGLRAIEPVKV